MTQTTFEPAVFQVSELSGYEFEDAVCLLLDRHGYEARVTARSADKGRDVLVETADETLVIECKCTQSSVGRPTIQKLHSATLSFSKSARGVVAATGGFTESARQYAREVDRTIELWGIDELMERGREVEVYFSPDPAGESAVLRPPEESPERTARRLETNFRAQLVSHPVPVEEAVSIAADESRYVGAIRVRYTLEETYGTDNYPYRIDEGGVRLFVEGANLDDFERNLWVHTTFTRRCQVAAVGGRPVESYFSERPSDLEHDVARQVARQQSTVHTYTGRNNVTYNKEINVAPDDVKTRSQRVLLQRRGVAIGSGPVRYETRVAVPGDAAPRFVEAPESSLHTLRDIHAGDRGLVCNDCGRIELASARARRCEDCDRSLCASHFWGMPSGLTFGLDIDTDASLCSDCYQRSEAGPARFPFRGFAAGVTIPFPLIPFVAADRPNLPLAARTVLPSALGWGVFAGAFLAAGANLIGPTNFNRLLAAWVVLLAVSLWTTYAWFRASRRHQDNLDKISRYEPAWEHDFDEKHRKRPRNGQA